MNAPLSTNARIHVAIAVTDIETAVPFYRVLFASEPTKLRPDYAKFELAEPPVNFTLNRTSAASGSRAPEHYGIQVLSEAAVTTVRARLEAAGIPIEVEDNVTCCYAVQDKIWATDPDGHHWEVFVTHGDTDMHSLPQPGQREGDAKGEDEPPCCAPTCCS